MIEKFRAFPWHWIVLAIQSTSCHKRTCLNVGANYYLEVIRRPFNPDRINVSAVPDLGSYLTYEHGRDE
jgi:hypothetical protein